MKMLTMTIMLAIFPTGSLPQTDVGCIGSNGYRLNPRTNEIEYNSILCEFGDAEATTPIPMNVLRQKYIESLSGELKEHALAVERKRQGNPKEDWQKFLDQTGRSFD
ncbi:hypothetical protein FIU94_10075 [Sulfitobacter sp. THAF37]|uniref:hypothetical protein n=1 Tax=Sulfitobacter sp. THAF37 TaxID=2587855 RepID=UPI0012680C80|nr:hypothetical protein [Sulfitobacter sp. THAF37]QFT59172.1 hypothetical protein FIU94_10075 [Sulfitobacter sp. THAF37]